MSRNLVDLEVECRGHGIPLPQKYGKRELMDLLAEFYYKRDQANEKYPRLHQIPVMLARKLVDEDEAAQNKLKDRCILEPKLDGCSALIHLGCPNGRNGVINRVTTRRRSDQTYRFTERTDNFPWLRDWEVPQSLMGSILHAEFVMPKGTKTGDLTTETERNASAAIMNCGADKSAALQLQQGKGVFHVFDMLFHGGLDIRDMDLLQRRNRLNPIEGFLPEYIKVVQPYKKDLYPSVDDVFKASIKQGYEGLMVKDPSSPYSRDDGSRPKAWYKWKKRESWDGYITGYIPGEQGFTGLVGGLKITGILPDGTEHWFAAVSNVELVQRKIMSNPDGSLKQEYYNRVVEVSGQGFSARSRRLNHATLDQWRDDKPKDQCLITFGDAEGP